MLVNQYYTRGSFLIARMRCTCIKISVHLFKQVLDYLRDCALLEVQLMEIKSLSRFLVYLLNLCIAQLTHGSFLELLAEER